MQPVLLIFALASLPVFASAATPPGSAGPAPAPIPAPAPVSAACPAILQYRFPRLQDDAPQELCQYAGKVILVVNTASYCGFTPQYEGLEALHARFAPRGLVVIGFPSNDFGAQEPGGSKQIADFCFNTYGVKFPMMGKTVVKGPGRHPFYATLDKVSGQAPRWNFHKYLIGRDGQVLGSYASEIKPQDRVLVAAIERALRP